MNDETVGRNRRLSHDEVSARAPKRFLIDVEETMRIVLEQEDTNRDFQVRLVASRYAFSLVLNRSMTADLHLRLWAQALVPGHG